MRKIASIWVLGLFALGCVVENSEDPGAGAAGQGGQGSGREEGGAAGSTASAEGGASENDCSVTAADDVCSSCVKNECCEVWLACVGECSPQIECYVPCLQDRRSLAAEDDAACRQQCDVADAKAQTALIDCLLPPESDDDEAGCRGVCF
jgi:hypothetical protein